MIRLCRPHLGCAIKDNSRACRGIATECCPLELDPIGQQANSPDATFVTSTKPGMACGQRPTSSCRSVCEGKHKDRVHFAELLSIAVPDLYGLPCDLRMPYMGSKVCGARNDGLRDQMHRQMVGGAPDAHKDQPHMSLIGAVRWQPHHCYRPPQVPHDP